MLRTAADLMQTKVISIRPTATLRELVQLLDEEEIHGAPVVDVAGNPVGVVSRSDLVAAMNEVDPDERPTARYYAVAEDEIDWSDEETKTTLVDAIEAERQVAEIMSTHVLSARKTATAGELGRKMVKNGVRRLLILERGKLVGIVSATDLLRCLVDYERIVSASDRARAARRRKPEAPRSSARVASRGRSR